MKEKQLSETQLTSIIKLLLEERKNPIKRGELPNASIQVELNKTYIYDKVQGIWTKFRIVSTDSARKIWIENYEMFIGYFDTEKEIGSEMLILWNVVNNKYEEVLLTNFQKAANFLRENNIW